MAFGTIRADGWYITNTEGIATLYLSIVDEGYTTRSTDDPASTFHRPRIKNAASFSIRREASFWPWGGGYSMAAFGSLQIDNYDGAFDELLSADLRDATVIFHLPDAASLGGATSISSLQPIATAVIDNVSSDNEDTITLSLKDTLARLDRPLPCRYNPPFVDSNAANRMIPITLGACRNVEPLLIDEANRIYQLADAPITNIAAMRDKGAPLDPNASPPQYTPALDASGVQLDTLPEGKFTCDISSEGAQVVIPGAVDVMNGDGILDDWPVALDPPTGWSYSSPTFGTITRFGTVNTYSQDYVAVFTTSRPYNTSGAAGKWMRYDTAVLEAGRTYRIKFTLERWSGSLAPRSGFMLRSDTTGFISDNGSITGGTPLQAPQFGIQPFTFTYTVPPGANRNIYAIAVGDPTYQPISIGFSGLQVELLGEFTEHPITGISLSDYVTEIVKNRAGEDSAIWSASDLTAIDDATGYLFGVHYETQPNILDALVAPLDSFCASMSTDADGVIRFPRLIDPRDGTVVADFDQTNVLHGIRVEVDSAKELTTLIGARRNWSIFGDSDFVTDKITVPQDVRERYKRPSQYQKTSSVTPAAQYDHARGAPVFDSVLDDPEDAQVEIDRVVSLYAPRIHADGFVHNGKRRFVTFTALWDDQASVGATVQVAVRDLKIGDVVSLTYPGNGETPRFDETKLFVAGIELFPYGQRIRITGWY